MCLGNKTPIIYLYTSHTLADTVAELYVYITGLEVSEDDEYPQHVCKSCLEKLEEACKLKQMSIDSRAMLENWVNEKEAEKLEPAEEIEPQPEDPVVIQQRHPVEVKRNFECNICGEKYTYKYHLVRIFLKV